MKNMPCSCMRVRERLPQTGYMRDTPRHIEIIAQANKIDVPLKVRASSKGSSSGAYKKYGHTKKSIRRHFLTVLCIFYFFGATRQLCCSEICAPSLAMCAAS